MYIFSSTYILLIPKNMYRRKVGNLFSSLSFYLGYVLLLLLAIDIAYRESYLYRKMRKISSGYVLHRETARVILVSPSDDFDLPQIQRAILKRIWYFALYMYFIEYVYNSSLPEAGLMPSSSRSITVLVQFSLSPGTWTFHSSKRLVCLRALAGAVTMFYTVARARVLIHPLMTSEKPNDRQNFFYRPNKTLN